MSSQLNENCFWRLSKASSSSGSQVGVAVVEVVPGAVLSRGLLVKLGSGMALEDFW